MEPASSPAPKPCIETGNLMTAYPDAKSILGGGSFGVVFATRGGQGRLAVKVVHVGKRWNERSEENPEVAEVIPLLDEASAEVVGRRAGGMVSLGEEARGGSGLARGRPPSTITEPSPGSCHRGLGT